MSRQIDSTYRCSKLTRSCVAARPTFSSSFETLLSRCEFLVRFERFSTDTVASIDRLRAMAASPQGEALVDGSFSLGSRLDAIEAAVSSSVYA